MDQLNWLEIERKRRKKKNKNKQNEGGRKGGGEEKKIMVEVMCQWHHCQYFVVESGRCDSPKSTSQPLSQRCQRCRVVACCFVVSVVEHRNYEQQTNKKQRKKTAPSQRQNKIHFTREDCATRNVETDFSVFETNGRTSSAATLK